MTNLWKNIKLYLIVHRNKYFNKDSEILIAGHVVTLANQNIDDLNSVIMFCLRKESNINDIYRKLHYLISLIICKN